MANTAFTGILNAAGHAAITTRAPDVDVVDTAIDTAKTATATAKTSGATADTNADTAKTDADAADTAAAKGTTGGTNYDAAVSALATLVADDIAPTQAHVTTFKNAWDLLIVETAAAKTATATAKASVATAETAVDTVVTDTTAADDAAALAVTASQAAQAAVSGGAMVIIDLAAITNVGQLRKIFNQIERAAIGAGRVTN